MSVPDEKKQSSTAQRSKDSLGLGSTGGQRGAEILAGLRTLLHSTPENEALSRLSGRIAGRIIMSVLQFGGQESLNYVAFRPAAFEKFIADYIASHLTTDDSRTVVELAAGFSSRALKMASSYPTVEFIEIDLPGVIKEKQRRLKYNYSQPVPDNLTWISADLGVEALSDVLDNRQVDVITMEGLTAYFTPSHNSSIVRNVRDSLKPGGICVVDIPWRKGMDDESSRSGLSLFSRQAGNFLTVVDTKEEAHQIFDDAGYTEIDIYETGALAETLPGIQTPVTDFSLFVVATDTKSANS